MLVDYNGEDFLLVRLGESDFDVNNVAQIDFINDGVVGTVFVSKAECDIEYIVVNNGTDLTTYYNAYIDTSTIGEAFCVDFDSLETYLDIKDSTYQKDSSSSLGFLHIVSLFTCAVLLGGYIMKSIRKITRY